MSREAPYKIIISGGGTGGHIYPAIAIAKEIEKQMPGTNILFVGALGRMEMQRVPEAGYKIIGLPVAGFQRRLTIKNLLFPFKLIISLLKARSIIKNFKPDMAIGVGGYASGPILKMAGALHIPTVIQEQNSYAGVTNKLLAKKAKRIFVAYPEMERYFPANKTMLSGNPVRQDILDTDSKKELARKHFDIPSEAKTLLVIGGSLGAHNINEAVAANLKLFNDNDIHLIWQTGPTYHSHALSTIENTSYKHVKVFAFIREMDLAYAAADIVVSRAGALSISELCIAGKPCILVPSPNVAEDHQTKNAMTLVKNGAAKMVRDDEAKEKLGMAALALLENAKESKILSDNIRKLALPDACKNIVSEIRKLLA